MSNFIKQFDQNSRKYYWVDRVTGQSQWQEPYSLSHDSASTPAYYNNSSTIRYQDSDLDHDSPPSYSQSMEDLALQYQSSRSTPSTLALSHQQQFTSSSGRQYHYYPPSSNYSPSIPAALVSSYHSYSQHNYNKDHQQQHHMQMQSAHPPPQLQPQQQHQAPYTYSQQAPIVVYRGNPTTTAVIGIPRLFPFFF